MASVAVSPTGRERGACGPFGQSDMVYIMFIMLLLHIVHRLQWTHCCDTSVNAPGRSHTQLNTSHHHPKIQLAE